MRTIRVEVRAATSTRGAFDAIAGLDNEWRIPFRGREIRWTQRSVPSPDGSAMTFAQVAGEDLRELSGWWRICPAAGGCEVVYEATYDLGVPIYDRILDPLIGKALADHVKAVIGRLRPAG